MLEYKVRSFRSQGSPGTLQRKQSMCSEEEFLAVVLAGINRGLQMKMKEVQKVSAGKFDPARKME